jgi:hypothetical protein
MNPGITLMKKAKLIPLAIIATLTIVAMCQAQRPVAEISINTEKLLPENRDKLGSLIQELQKYINDYSWTDNALHYDIPIQINIFFDKVQPKSYEDQYDAQFVISNESDFQRSDKKWRFPYMQNKPFTHAEQFQPLTGMMDFYINIILGNELDKRFKLGGSAYYQKAFQVAQLSKFSDFYSTGWKERSDDINKILEDSQKAFRELAYFFIQGEQDFRKDDRKAAGQYLRVVMLRLQKMSADDENVKRFYQLYNLSLARMLSALGMRPELLTLVQLDPDNAVTYRQFLEQVQP